MSGGETPSQSVGPFFAFAMAGRQYGYAYEDIASGEIADEKTPGERIRIVGRVLDGAGTPINDALIEIWQADAEGRYPHPADGRASNQRFRGFGRFGTGTDAHNRFIFHTIKPGRVDDTQAPHLNVIVLMRGLLNHAYTRAYFSDETEANAGDAVLQSVPEARRGTLVAKREEAPAGPVYRFDIHMQGDSETVFFDV